MLQDLAKLKAHAEQEIRVSGDSTILVSDELKQAILEAYREVAPNDEVMVQEAALYVTTNGGGGLSAYLPYQWMVRVKCCAPFISALVEYAGHVDALKLALDNTAIDSDLVMRDLPKIDWENNFDGVTVDAIRDFLRARFPDADQQEHFRLFLDGRTWLGEDLAGKKLNRGQFDYIGSCLKKIVRLIDAMAGKFPQFVKAYINSQRLRDLLDQVDFQLPSAPPEGFVPENRIYYGAPGTGKSHRINGRVDGANTIETVFHPDTQYSDFVGCLKPSMNTGNIEYSFRPGPFTEALILAAGNPGRGCYLVIEEINRASAPAVFGEIFQLLDRTLLGESRYEINVSDPDMKAYLEVHAPQLIITGKLKIPANLSILATMNSSDQAVMPMDTAFKRRWKFEYIPIDFADCPIGALSLSLGGVAVTVSWKDFAESVNDELASANIPEDRLMGPWFLGLSELEDEDSSRDALCGKLFMYLWDDVLRHDDRTRIFGSDIRNYGELTRKFSQGIQVFSEALVEKLRNTASFRGPEQEGGHGVQNVPEEAPQIDGGEES